MIHTRLGRRSHSRRILMCFLMLESPTLQLDGLHIHAQQFQGMEVLPLLSEVECATTWSIFGMSFALDFFFSRIWVKSEVMLSIWEVILLNETVLSMVLSITMLKFAFSKANSESCNSYGEWEWIWMSSSNKYERWVQVTKWASEIQKPKNDIATYKA